MAPLVGSGPEDTVTLPDKVVTRERYSFDPRLPCLDHQLVTNS